MLYADRLDCSGVHRLLWALKLYGIGQASFRIVAFELQLSFRFIEPDTFFDATLLFYLSVFLTCRGQRFRRPFQYFFEGQFMNCVLTCVMNRFNSVGCPTESLPCAQWPLGRHIGQGRRNALTPHPTRVGVKR